MAKLKPETIIIPEISIQQAIIDIEGISPLVTHKWDNKSKEMILNKQLKKATKGREAKDPKQDFLNSIYWIPPSNRPNSYEEWLDNLESYKYGFPAAGVKKALIDAVSFVPEFTKVHCRGAIHVEADFDDLIEIVGVPDMREDMVRVQNGAADIRYRAEFYPWEASIYVSYNDRIFSLEQIVNLFQIAGFSIGLGEYRPQKGGSWGRFRVKAQKVSGDNDGQT